jgi:CMP/dCMP kinase
VIKHLIVSIDGPVASGKTTVGSRVAKKLKIKFLDSGRLYRVVAYSTLDKDVELSEHLKNIDFELKGERFFLDGVDITKKLDASEVGERASVLSKQPILRSWVNQTIKKMGLNNSIVVAGRDIGTVVLPSAHVKIFLTANPKIRAHRRFLDEKGRLSEEKILTALKIRDERDSTRDVAPLKPAETATIIDSSKMSKKQVIREILNLSKKYLKSIIISKWWRFSYFVSRTLSRWLFKIEIYGRGNIPATGPVVVIANHASLLDVFFVGQSLPRMGSYIGKEELFKIPVIAACVRGFGAIPVKRGGVGKEMVKAVYSVLKRGGLLSIFPEGTRSKTGKLTGEYHSGAIQFAHKTDAILIPVGIVGAFDALPLGAKLPRRSKIVVNVGKPFEWDRTEKKPTKEFYDDVVKKAMQKIAELSSQE